LHEYKPAFYDNLNNKSLLEDTVDRIQSLALPSKKIGVVTTKDQSSYVSKLVGNKIDFVLQQSTGEDLKVRI